MITNLIVTVKETQNITFMHLVKYILRVSLFILVVKYNFFCPNYM
jgi:hypothetical protein